MSDALDPNSATSAAFSRKTFVNVAAGAAVTVAAPSGALAADTADFGKPHAPIVAPDDPAIVAAHVALTRPDADLDAYAAWPKRLTATTPGIVLVQHIWGVDSTIRDDVRRYAKAGFICIAPALYTRTHPPSGDGVTDISVFLPAAAALDDTTVHGDLLAARAWLLAKAPSAKIGLTGFCMGGGIALKQLIGTTDYAAASIFYGDVRPGTPRDGATGSDTFAYAAKISTPIRGNYGERDTSIAPADVRSLFAVLASPHELNIYQDAGHAFFDDTRKSYVPTAAADAWAKTLAWFRTYLT